MMGKRIKTSSLYLSQKDYNEQDWLEGYHDWAIKKIEGGVPFKMPEKPKCDCGGEKAKTTHVDWCATNGGKK